jgi:hypothetical protein
VPVYEWIDPGIATDHPAAFGAAWLNPDDTLEIFHTFKLIGGTAGTWPTTSRRSRRRFDYKPRGPVVIDPSARNKHHQTGRSTQDEYRKHGIYTKPGQNDVTAGINAMKERFKTHRILLHRDCHEYAGDGCSPRPTSPRSGATTAGRATSARQSEDAAKPSRSRRRTTSPTAAATW